MCDGCMNYPLVRVCPGNHLCDGEVLLQEVEGDLAEVEVLAQLGVGKKNLFQYSVTNLKHFTIIMRAIN